MLNADIRADISSSSYVIPEQRKKDLYQMSFVLPSLYGQVKSHKPIAIPWGQWLLPTLINEIKAYTYPSFRLAKFLAKEFRAITSYLAPHSIADSIQLAEEVKGMRFPYSCRIVSFDVKLLFTKVPAAQKTLDIMKP